jgi:hypothetical protein
MTALQSVAPDGSLTEDRVPRIYLIDPAKIDDGHDASRTIPMEELVQQIRAPWPVRRILNEH